MALSHELISQFAKIVKEDKKKSSESTVYGTVVTDGNGNKYVKLDGSDQLTPLTDDERPSADTSTSSANEGERVSVLIKDHTATVTGNISSPAVRTGDFNDLNDQVTDIKKFDIVIAEQVQANEAHIKKLQTDKAEVGDLTTATAKITELETKKANVEDLTAAKAEITDLKTTKIDAEVADAKYATIENLEATDAKFDNLSSTYATITDLNAQKARIDTLNTEKLSAEDADLKYATIGNLEAAQADIDSLEATHASFETATAENFTAVNASIDDLEAKKLTATDADLKYANIDFSNIGSAAVEKLFTESGIIKDLVVSEGHITGELVGVTIKGDIIEGGTVKADKLVVKGSDGLFYKLNTDGVSTTAEQTEYNSLNGSVITAKSITAEKVNVNDLVAFGATIGGINIADSAIYSGVKSSADNTTRGFYLDKDGQFAVGDADNFFKYYKDADGNYKLEISASSISIRSGDTTKNVETAINEAYDKADAVEERVILCETAIDQTNEKIELRAIKTEVDALIKETSDDLKSEFNDGLSGLESTVENNRESAQTDINDAKANIQNLNDTVSKYFTFDTDGLTISCGENRLKLKLSNDKIEFIQNGATKGWWDGNDFHTGNVYIDVSERAQFGNFAFVPRSDGSLMFLKVSDTEVSG